ncbi:MAG: lipase [Pseudonocardiales bacterium]|nr:MAG: lipase [Pseudonocardiales bacterium]
MSLQRRIALVAAVVVLGLTVGIALAAAAVDRSRSAASAVPQDRPGPVLLVPGYGGDGRALGRLATRLRSAGRDAQVVALPGDGTGDLREQAKALGTAAKAALARTGAGSVDVVGYSAGGIVTRLWIRSYGGAALTRRVVTLGSPHHGTDLAGLASAIQPGACPTACRQLAPGSDLLNSLNSGDETPAGPRWVSLWSTSDQVVTPPDSARLSGAVDIVLQDVCSGVRVEHGELPTNPLVQAIVLSEVAATPVVTPRPGDCAGLR